MKKYNNIQELWSYCLFCPICQDITRDMQISVGPDDTFSLSSFEKNNNILTLNCLFFVKKQKYHIKYDINCIDNTFNSDISDPTPSDKYVTKASLPYFFFYIRSNCRVCDASHTNGTDLELDLSSKIIFNIGVETDGIYLLKEKNKYHISFEYDRNKMIISRCYEDKNTGEILDDNKPFNFPIIDFDFSNIEKVINRIKTILTFS
jgi:hypothetical protein